MKSKAILQIKSLSKLKRYIITISLNNTAFNLLLPLKANILQINLLS